MNTTPLIVFAYKYNVLHICMKWKYTKSPVIVL